MIGAILGDIAGSKYEFINNRKIPDRLFMEGCFPTDDSYLTIAIMNALIASNKYKGKDNYYEVLENEVVRYTLYSYIDAPWTAGWGGGFSHWCKNILVNNNIHNVSDLRKANKIVYEKNKSAGNGSCMKCSAVPYFSSSLEECEEITKLVVSITHDSYESYRGSVCLNTSIYLALSGKSKDEIKENILKYYPNVKDLSYKYLNKNYEYSELTVNTMPASMVCFLESDSFYNALEMAISIGGDADTLGAITGALAESYYSKGSEPIMDILKILNDLGYKNNNEFSSYFYESIKKAININR